MEAIPNFIGYGKMTWRYGDSDDEVRLTTCFHVLSLNQWFFARFLFNRWQEWPSIRCWLCSPSHPQTIKPRQSKVAHSWIDIDGGSWQSTISPIRRMSMYANLLFYHGDLAERGYFSLNCVDCKLDRNHSQWIYPEFINDTIDWSKPNCESVMIVSRSI